VVAVGKDVTIPEDATVIDAAGGTILPGIIDPHFEVSVAAATADAGPRTVVFRGRAIGLGGAPNRGGGFTRIADNFYPYDAGFKHLPRTGLTRLNLVTNGVGQAAVVRVTPADPGHMLDRPDGVAFAAVTNSSDSLDQIRTGLEGASRSRPGGGRPGATAGTSTQLWADVAAGKTPLVVSAANAAAVVHLLQVVEPHKNVKLVVYAGGEALAEAVDALKGRSVRVVIRPNLELVPNSRDRFAPARMLHEAGIDFAFSLTARPPGGATGVGVPGGLADTDPAAPTALEAEFPLFPVAVQVKAGLPRKAALEALTKRPAAMLGLGETHGTIETGKAADLLLYTGDPLDPAGRLRLTLIDGRTVYAN
jgi:hypothetical protein